MTPFIVLALEGAFGPPAVTFLISQALRLAVRPPSTDWQRFWLITWAVDAGAAALIVGGLAITDDVLGSFAATATISSAVAWYLWWRRRRDRRRAVETLGAKSRALRDALARRAREAARPSPVLRPSLRGAR